MSKVKVYELAKELGKDSKDVVKFLEGKNIEVKNHMSTISEDEAAMVKKALGGSKASASGDEAKAAPKKKNIVHVFRPQNTRDGSRNGRRQAGRPAGGAKAPQNAKPMQVQNGRPAPGSKPAVKSVAKPAVKPVAEKPAEAVKPAEVKPEVNAETVQSKKPESTPVQPQSVANQTEKVQEKNTSVEKPVKNREEQNRNSQSQEGRRERSQGGYNRDRQGRNDRNNDRGDRNGRPQGDRRDNNRGRNDRNNDRNDRPQGDRRDNNRGRNDRNDRQGGFNNRDRQGRNGNDRFQNNDHRKKNNNPAIPAPALEGQKPQQRKNKGKEDFKKKDYRKDDEDRMPKGRKQKNDQKQQMQKPQQKEQKVEETIKSIVIPEVLTIKELADKMKIVPSVIVKKLFMQGKIVTVNQEIDYDTAEEIALEFDVLCEKEEVVDVIEELLKEEEEDEKKMKKRPPVVCVMGHVDHGKTSLLDAIRHTNVIDREAGGITQHIGASVVTVNGEKITFLDTPGHEAFTAMRMRGANSTDIAILVVAADDGVMPQTVEAINHAKAAGIEIVVAINKIDKPSANIDRVKQELSEYELIPEDWGGSTIFVPVSAKTGEGIQDLMEMLLLTAEVSELKANPNRRARGLVIEAQLDKGKGPVAKGKLSLDDLFTQIKEGNLKELNIVVKADVQGSVEAIKQSLLKLSNEEVVVKIIHGGVGAINESDVSLASASNAIIIGFNVRPDATAKETAEREGVDVRLYRVIYNAIEDVQAAMKGMLDPVFEEKVLGHAEVRQTFKASGVGTIAGSYVLDGTFERDCQARIVRDGIVIYDGKLASLRRFKDDVKEVRAGYECGFVFENYNDVKEGDQVEAFKMVEIPR